MSLSKTISKPLIILVVLGALWLLVIAARWQYAADYQYTGARIETQGAEIEATVRAGISLTVEAP